MRGIILAGGLGVRMQPTSNRLNKHLLLVGEDLLVTHSIRAFKEAGVEDVLILSNGEHREYFLKALGTGEEWGVNLFYRGEQEVKGSGQTILMAEPFVRDERKFAVMHGDSVFRHGALPYFPREEAPCLFAMPTPTSDFDDYRKYGQVRLSTPASRVMSLKEKTEERFSDYIRVAVWIFRPDCFGIIRELQRQHDGEVHTTEVVLEYIRRQEMRYALLPARSYIDCGTWPALRKAEELFCEQTPREQQSIIAAG